MLLPFILLNNEFNEFWRKNRLVKNASNSLPNIYEGGYENALKNVINPDWIGDSENTTCVDMIKNGHSIECKKLKNIGPLMLNSTPLNKKTKLSELPKEAQTILKNINNKITVFSKEYLIYIQSLNLHISYNPEIDECCFNDRECYNKSMLEYHHYVSEIKKLFNFISENKPIMEFIKNNNEIAETIKLLEDKRNNNPILNSYEHNGLYSLYNKNNNSNLALRHRSMWSYNLPKLLKSLNIKNIEQYSSIVIELKNESIYSHLTTYSNMLITEKDNIIVLGYKK